MSEFDDFLADVQAERCWLLEIYPLSLAPISDGSGFTGAFSDAPFGVLPFSEGGGDVGEAPVLRYSTHGFTSQPADAPGDTYYDARLMGDVKIARRIYGRSGLGGLARTQADIGLINADGELDALPDDYALDGRVVRLLLGDPSAALATFGVVFAGVIEAIDRSNRQMLRLRLSDGIARLDVPANPTTYAGSGGLEGGDDLTGKAKPRLYGNVQNWTPPLVDSANLIYHVHDGLASDVPSVYDRQIGITKGADYASQSDLLTIAPAAGYYRQWKDASGSYFRLGSTPAGQVTCDVVGDATGGYVDTTADILERLLLIAGIDSSLLDAAAFTQLNTDAPAEVGIPAGIDGRSVGDMVEQLLAGVGGYGGFSRLGVFTAGVIKVASGAAADSFTEEDISDLIREALPPEVDPVVWRVRVAWGRNYTVQTDLAAAVSAARRTFAAEAERISKSEDLSVKSRRLLAVEYGPTGNLYAQQADADAEALRLLNLWKTARGLFRVPLPARALARDLGDVVTLTIARQGFDAGKDARVLAHTIRGGKAAELMVLI